MPAERVAAPCLAGEAGSSPATGEVTGWSLEMTAALEAGWMGHGTGQLFGSERGPLPPTWDFMLTQLKRRVTLFADVAPFESIARDSGKEKPFAGPLWPLGQSARVWPAVPSEDMPGAGAGGDTGWT